MMMFSNSVALGIVAKIGSKTCIIICEFSIKKKGGLREKWNSFLFSASPKKLEMVSLSSDWLTGYKHRARKPYSLSKLSRRAKNKQLHNTHLASVLV